MTRHIIAFAAAACLLAPAGIAAQTQDVGLRAAMETETVKGDLKAAIEQYRKLAADTRDRATAATALVRMAECYQKLGDAQARQIFERVVRDYADQKEAVAAARTRLGRGESASRSKGDRPVWSGRAVDGFGTVSPDGRYLTYVDWAGSAGLMIRDLAAGTSRRLTAGTVKDGQTQYSTISRDGKRVAYQWLNSGGRYELRTVDLQGSGIPEPHRVLDLEDSRGIVPFDWSPDGKWVAVHVQRKDFSGQIGIVSVLGGELRILKSVDWQGPIRMSFSRDGQYIAYDIAVDERRLERHVYVIAVDGSHESMVVDDRSRNVVMGWSPDGTHLLFASNRSGSSDLWALPIDHGKSRGAAYLVKSDVGADWSNGITSEGTLYVWKDASPIYLQVASIDLNAGRLTVTPSPPQFIGSRGRPVWSPDGNQLVYETCSPLGGGPCRLLVRTGDSSQAREISTSLNYFFFLHFSPDGRSLVTRANDRKGHPGIYRIAVPSGETTLLTDDDGINPELIGDGSTLVYQRRRRGSLAVIQRNLTTGEQIELVDIPGGEQSANSISPDRRFIARVSASADQRTLSVLPLTGGSPRTLMRVSAPAVLYGAEASNPEWAPDGRSVFVIKALGDEADSKELWQIPIDGGAPRKLEIDVNRWVIPGGGFRISPDGRQIAFVAATGGTGQEIWAIENFLPKRRPSTPAAK